MGHTGKKRAFANAGYGLFDFTALEELIRVVYQD